MPNSPDCRLLGICNPEALGLFLIAAVVLVVVVVAAFLVLSR